MTIWLLVLMKVVGKSTCCRHRGFRVAESRLLVRVAGTSQGWTKNRTYKMKSYHIASSMPPVEFGPCKYLLPVRTCSNKAMWPSKHVQVVLCVLNLHREAVMIERELPEYRCVQCLNTCSLSARAAKLALCTWCALQSCGMLL